MEPELQALKGREVHGEGRRRLRLVLAGIGAGACAAAMALVLVFYGTPYNPIWWAVMAAVVGGSAAVATLFAPLIEWVIAGYSGAPRKS